MDSNGQVHAWGYNGFGQLGNNTITSSSIPIAISLITGSSIVGKTIVAIATGSLYSIALDSTGQVHAWGANDNGQLGNNTTIQNNIPIAISSITGSSIVGKMIVKIATGAYYNIALDSIGQLHAWGSNLYGQVGNNTTTTPQTMPIAISSIAGSSIVGKTIVAITSGQYHTLALDSTGQIHTWGYNNYGQLGNNTLTQQNIPIAISSIAGSSLIGKTIVAIAAGSSHTIALDSTGQVHAWGGASGQLGNNTVVQSTIPIVISSITGSSIMGKTIVAITAGCVFSVALDSTGQIHAWGNNTYGQLGNNTTVQSLLPIPISYGSISSLSVTAPVSTTFTPFFVNFTGQHRVFVAGETVNSQGQKEGFIVVCDQDDYITAHGDAPLGKFIRGNKAITIGDALPVVSLANKAYDKRVFGVLSLKQFALSPEMAAMSDNQNSRLVECGDVRLEVNAIGDGAIWVSDINGPFISGDLITSSELPGYGQLQSTDDAMHNYTVAKITCSCDFTAPQQPVYEIQVDENGLNVLDPVTGHPVWVAQTTTIMVDPATNELPLTSDPSNLSNLSNLIPKVVPLTEPKYEMRYVTIDGSEISQAAYDDAVAGGQSNEVYRAAFVGCTYHCG